MSKVFHYIDGREFDPRDSQEIEITVDWLNKKETGSINVTDLSFVLDANEFLQQRVLDGLSGGVGIFEGVPYTIKFGDRVDPDFVFEGYLDLSDDPNVYGKEELILSLKKKKGDDWLNDVADGFSFAFLYDQGVITDSDFKKVDYVINYIPDGMQLITLSISIYMMVKELIENVQRLVETIADITDASFPVLGVSVGLGAGVVTAWDWGNFILVALKAIARIAYIIAITIAIINLIEEIFEQLLPKKRQHLGMTFRRMMERGCEHLGMNFQSSIDELEWIHIPRKFKKGGERGETGFPSNTEPIYTFADLIRTLKEMFNADFRIIGNTFIFERRDQFVFPSSYRMPDVFNDQDRLLDVHSFNTDEMVANYNVNWAFDIQDQNTLDDQSGRVFQAITSPRTIRNEDFVTIKGLIEVGIPFSLGRRKDRLTTVEEVAKDLGSVVDTLTGTFGRGTNFESQIESRIGSLLLSSHFLSVGKVVKMAGSKLATSQRTELDARVLWDRYHYINSFADYQGTHNQWWIFKEQRVPMSRQEFKILLENNQATDADGNEYQIDRVVYDPSETQAVIDYRVRKKYTNNLKIEIV